MFTYEQIQSLNDLELAVYSYVIMHMEKCVHMKIRELADKVHVSTVLPLSHKSSRTSLPLQYIGKLNSIDFKGISDSSFGYI